jgi:cytochrome c5
MIMSAELHIAEHRPFGKTRECALMAIVLALAVSIVPERSWAQGGGRSGKEVVETSCVACHGTGASGAPKIGDNKAWAKRASQGLTSLTQNALKGIRQMPPHGGNVNLTDIEIERAITYMVNQSGGHWIEPLDRAALRAARSGEQVVRAQCAKCHETGVGGAPRIGDRAAWLPRVKLGLDTLILSAINGHGGMPARGGAANLTDPEIRSAVVYMFNAGTVSAKTVPAAKAVGDGHDYRVVDGTTIYFGVVPADAIRRRPKDYPESEYGIAPAAPQQYFVTVALFDANNGQRITDATVRARVSTAKGAGPEKVLEPMTIAGSRTYGSYFAMAGAGTYMINVQIRRPGAPDAIKGKFEYTHP